MSDLAWPAAPPAVDWAVKDEAPVALSQVWVAVIVVQYQMSRRDIPVTQPLTSAAMLFAPRTEESMTRAVVVAAATTEEQCRQLLAEWKTANTTIGGEEIVTSVPFGRAASANSVRAVAHCIDCGGEIGDGFRCDPCTKKYWQLLRDADPDWASEPAP